MTMPQRLKTFETLLGLLKNGERSKLVDLGAGHGAFSILAANQGWEVTAVDARDERWPLDLPSSLRVRWIKEDVRSHDLSSYSVISCLGLFYHLTLRDQLQLLARMRAPLILDTHLDHGVHKHPLSKKIKDGLYEGRLYSEPNATTSASGNRESFWPTLASLHEMLRRSGYHTVLTVEPWTEPDRTFFLAMR